MGLPGVVFAKAWPNRTITSLAGIKVNILGLTDLIKVKRQTGREVNGSDLKNLRYVLKKTGPSRKKR